LTIVITPSQTRHRVHRIDESLQRPGTTKQKRNNATHESGGRRAATTAAVSSFG